MDRVIYSQTKQRNLPNTSWWNLYVENKSEPLNYFCQPFFFSLLKAEEFLYTCWLLLSRWRHRQWSSSALLSLTGKQTTSFIMTSYPLRLAWSGSEHIEAFWSLNVYFCCRGQFFPDLHLLPNKQTNMHLCQSTRALAKTWPRTQTLRLPLNAAVFCVFVRYTGKDIIFFSFLIGE